MTNSKRVIRPEQSAAAEFANLLKVRPYLWVQGTYSREIETVVMGIRVCETRHCLAGFIYEYADEHGLDTLPFRNDFDRLFRAVTQIPASFPSGSGLAGWNDASSRTVQDVISICERIAAS